MAFATRIGLVVLGLLIQGMLAYALLPEGRGSYAVCVLFGTLLGLIFTPGAEQGAQYFVATRQVSVSQGVSCALTIGLVGGGLAIAVAIPLIHSDIAFFHKAQTRSFYLGIVLIPLTACSLAVEHQLVALRRFGRLAVFSLLRVAVNVLALVLLVWGRGLGVDGAIASFAAGHLVLIAACLWDLRRHCGLVLESPSRASLTHILGYGSRYHVARIGEGIGPQVGIVVLGLLASQADIGLFAAANTLMLGFLLISNSVGNALMPRIAGKGRPELVVLCLRLVCGVTLVALLALLAISTPAGSAPAFGRLPAGGAAPLDPRSWDPGLCRHGHIHDVLQRRQPPGDLLVGGLPWNRRQSRRTSFCSTQNLASKRPPMP